MNNVMIIDGHKAVIQYDPEKRCYVANSLV